MSLAPTRLACLLCALVAGAALGVALAAEYWGGLAPCALCLWERVPYRIAIGAGVIGALLPDRLAPRKPWLLLVLLAMLAGAGLAAVHVGVEQGFWPSPLPECAAKAVTFGSIAERLAAMPAMPAKPCDEPTFLIPALRVSMAAMNLIYALAFAAGIAIYLANSKGRRR